MDDPRCLAPLETLYNFLECFKFVFKLDALILFTDLKKGGGYIFDCLYSM